MTKKDKLLLKKALNNSSGIVTPNESEAGKLKDFKNIEGNKVMQGFMRGNEFLKTAKTQIEHLIQ